MTRSLFRLFDESAHPSNAVSTAPQSLSDLSDDEAEQDAIVRSADRLLSTELRVDYSDFGNHVYLNSALDYFNVTGQAILSRYPIDGDRNALQGFLDDLDGYQRYVLSQWPSRLGHLVFSPAVSSSYVQIDDVGQEDGVTRTSLLSPGTGSWTVEAWYNSARSLTGSDDASYLVHKVANSAGEKGVSLFLSGSSVFFRVLSGSSFSQVSAPAHIGVDGYVMAVLDRSSQSGSLSIYTGTLSRFPVLVSSASVSFGGTVAAASASMFLGSGTLSGKTTVYYSGTMDDVRVWRVPLDLSYASSSFNRKAYARGSLMGIWRFNETGSSGIQGMDSLVADYSGHGINGRVKNYWSGARGSGSMFYESPDPILDPRYPEVLAYIVQQQTSGSDYDRGNGGKITDLVPQGYFETASEQDLVLLTDFLYTLARHFDSLRLYAEHFRYLLRVNYTEYDQVPDAKLEDMARFYGWELPSGFVDAHALQYFIGRDVQTGQLSNEELDRKLYEIKVSFWRRTLNNLAHIYKTKGTRESVRALMRCYGVNDTFMRLKEYGYEGVHEISTQRISSERSTYALQLGSGTLSGSVLYTETVPVTNLSVETRVMWPTSGNLVMSGSEPSGSLWFVQFRNQDSCDHHLQWRRTSVDGKTGSLVLVVGSASLTVPSLPIFNDSWYNVAVVKETTTGSYTVRVSKTDGDSVAYSTSSVFYSSAMTPTSYRATGSITSFRVGSTGTLRAQQWMDEFRVWSKALTSSELEDHCLNYRSVGADRVSDVRSYLLLHWRLDGGAEADASGHVYVEDFSMNNRIGTGSFAANKTPFRKFLNPYAYIAGPDLGWTDDKVRIFEGQSVTGEQRPYDSRLLSLELNMVDQLNEDISQMMDSVSELSDALGHGAAHFRGSYPELDGMRREYFRRLTDRLNFRVFVDMLQFFDRSFVTVLRKLIPARAVFTGDEVVVESHTLERSKVQYAYRPVRDTRRIYEGVITMLRRGR